MAIMLDGTQLTSTTRKPTSTRATYKPPTQTQYKASQNESQRRAKEYADEMRKRQQAQDAYTQRMQAQADAYRKQQQAMQQQRQVSVPPSPTAAQQTMNSWYGGGGTMNMQAQPDRWATTPQAQQMIKNYQQMPQPDRWAKGSQANQYINNYQAYKKKQDDELRLLRQMSWQNGPAANFFFEGLGPPVPPPSTAQAPTIDYGGGDWGDWNYPDYGGGGGGGTYTPKPPEWWVEMVQWRI